VIRNGSGTAVVMVIFGLHFWIGSSFYQNHRKWNVFLNPFDLPQNFNETVWMETVLHNRLYLLTGIIIAILYGLLNLQNREKFL